MKILVINAGSSSLKYQLIDMTDEKVLAKGNCERIGTDGAFIGFKTPDGKKIERKTQKRCELYAEWTWTYVINGGVGYRINAKNRLKPKKCSQSLKLIIEITDWNVYSGGPYLQCRKEITFEYATE